MGRRRPRSSDRVVRSDEARALLKDDIPQAVKTHLLLALRGGRQERRRCIGCGRQGTQCKVWSPAAVWQIDNPDCTGIKVYWLCRLCDSCYQASGLPPEVERKLRGG
jgi:hypothetical protein